MKKQYLLAMATVLLAVGGISLAQQRPTAAQPAPGVTASAEYSPPIAVPARGFPDPSRPSIQAPLGQAPIVPPGVEVPGTVPIPMPADQAPPRPPVSFQFQIPLTQPQPSPAVASPKLEEMSLDQLLDAVEGLRARKAELEKKEQEMLKLINRKAEEQKERIDRLNDGAPEVPTNRVPIMSDPIPPASSY